MAMDDITAVAAEVPRDAAGAIADFLAGEGVFCSAWEDREGGPSRIEIYVPDNPGAPEWLPYAGMLCATPDEAAARIGEACAAAGVGAATSVSRIRQEDWAESWKRFFKTIRISEHLVVRPPWEDYAARPGERVLVLDPGMSFGTGKHATTQACLRFLDDLSVEDPGRDVLDIGCGSGILSIAASLLGFREVRGIDNDPDAVRVAGENAAANGAAASFAFGDLADCAEKAQVVVANVLAVVLERFAAEVSATVRRVPGNALILSGILDTQYPAVRDAYLACGAAEERSILVGEWRTGLFRFPSAPPKKNS